MMEVPGSEWKNDFDEKSALRSAPRLKGAIWKRVPGVVRHVFTHFPLELAVFLATVPRPTKTPTDARWAPLATLAGEALPNVMRKVIVHALDSDRGGKHGRRRG
jgi:A/G-specific adenine glycosylase